MKTSTAILLLVGGAVAGGFIAHKLFGGPTRLDLRGLPNCIDNLYTADRNAPGGWRCTIGAK